MSINSDLDYDLVEAVLSRNKEDDSPAQTKELFDVLVSFHEALMPLVKQSRRRDRRFIQEECAASQKGITTSSH